jgi:hypothetical protein
MELLEWMPPLGSQLASGRAFPVPKVATRQKAAFQAETMQKMPFIGKIERSTKLRASNFDHHAQKITRGFSWAPPRHRQESGNFLMCPIR